MHWTWNLDPIALHLFGLDVRWYGLVYVLGFFFTLYWSWHLWQKKHPKRTLSKLQFENFCFGLFFSGVIGGRLGVFLFYSPSTFIFDFFEIFKIWHGGMSIHGGVLGALIFGFFWTRKHKLSLLDFTDILVIPFALVLAFGRGANFMNGELVGRITDQSWGIIFPHIDEYLRHPSQLYEMAKNFILFGILYLVFRSENFRRGQTSAFFLIGYGIMRFLIEFFREPETWIWILTTGQALCLAMILIGSLLWQKAKQAPLPLD